MKHSENVSETEYVVVHQVEPGRTGVRLDSFLKEYYRSRSREAIKRAIDGGSITVLREQSPHLIAGRLKPSMQLIAGDEIRVLSERKPEPEVSFDYKILHEDETLLVIDKPANLPVHPAGRYFFNTLLIHLRTRGHRDPLIADREYFLVHRIDKETSGVLVLTKDRVVCTHLTRQFAARTTQKTYLAIVYGVPEKEEFTVDLAMQRSNRSSIKLKMMISPESEGGQNAQTSFRRMGVYGNFSLLECKPRTGRQHQIRVHLEAAGHPIVGDKLYGRDEEEARGYIDRRQLTPEAEARLVLPRHALHAASIEFENPSTGLPARFEAPLPKDLQAFLDKQPRSTS